MQEKRPEDYMKEMMELYKRSNREPVPRPDPQPVPRPEPIPEPPEILLPEDDTPPETSFGWLQVTARSADSALPVEGASVMVLKRNGTENTLVQTLLTDESGKTPKIQLPAPAISENPMQPFSVYTVKIHRPGYIRLESRDVPIFSGVTSVQPFAMIPLPKGEGEDTPAVINENTEPEF